MLEKITNKLIQVGLSKLTSFFYQKVTRKYFFWKHQNRYLQFLVKHQTTQKTFAHNTNFSLEVLINQLDLPKNIVLQKANEALENCFEIFGTKQRFSEIKWREYNDDVKYPWELSRLQHLIYLGKAYEITKDEKYPLKFVEHVEDWLKQNQFLEGVNWTCPMEVAIRSINLLWAFHFFKNSISIPKSFWQIFVQHLHNNAYYLENNWEIFFKNNNHYLADLLGYFYLCLFFKDNKYFKKRLRWCHKKLLNEFFHQIHPDGSSYEGSTNYHKLVTEMFLQFKLLSEANNLQLPKAFKLRFNKMLKFLNNCTDQASNLVQIGDNDGGKITTGIVATFNKNNFVSHYSNFGLTILKDKNWHITFRHPTYRNNQPTGHFHNDELSITVSINGIPIIVDPGTYLYTGNPTLRNLMRSEESHNSFYIEDLPKHTDLFTLPKVVQEDTAIVKNNFNNTMVINYHKKYQKLGIIPYRSLIFNNEEQSLEIADCFEINKQNSFKTAWTLNFHPKIELKQIDQLTWEIIHNKKMIAHLKTNLHFSKEEAFYSESYGLREKTIKLKAIKTLDSKQEKIIITSKS